MKRGEKYTNFLEKHGIKPVVETEVSDSAQKGVIKLLDLIGKSDRNSHSGGHSVNVVEIVDAETTEVRKDDDDIITVVEDSGELSG